MSRLMANGDLRESVKNPELESNALPSATGSTGNSSHSKLERTHKNHATCKALCLTQPSGSDSCTSIKIAALFEAGVAAVAERERGESGSAAILAASTFIE